MANWTGSSPRMRGTLLDWLAPVRCLGIIPAHAGNTCACSLPRSRRRDHPRACGEHNTVCLGLACARGSSPRMRGTPTVVDGHEGGEGIIPAHAGNTSVPGTSRRSQMGSSPRMRGTLSVTLSPTRSTGIIPAHAGNTWGYCATTAWCGDHPRACGEHSTRLTRRSIRPGSSPRMRGTPHHVGRAGR